MAKKSKLEKMTDEVLLSGMALLSNRFSTALLKEKQLCRLLDDIKENGIEDMPPKARNEIISVLETLQLQKIDEIVKAVSLVCDRQGQLVKSDDGTVSLSIKVV